MAEEDDIPAPISSEDGEIDIEKIYSDFIKIIDNYRSNVNINNPNNKSSFNKITPETFNSGGNGVKLTVETTPQESRCHAFFRLLGLPVVSDNGFYNPGLDLIKNPGQKRKIDIEKKVSIANNQIKSFKEFKKISDARENYVNDFLPIFSNNRSIDASVLAVSAANVRPISSVFAKNSDFIENPFDPQNQAYEILDTSQIGEKIVPFSTFTDSNGNTPTKFSKKRNHIIKPFIVDARIDLSTATVKKIAIPFVENSTQLKTGETTSTKRPLIEKIIRDRFATKPETALGSIKSFLDLIKETPYIKDAELVKSVSSGKNFKLPEAQQLARYFNIILLMTRLLANSQKTIQNAQSLYYWVPIPSKTGVEDGVSVRPMIINASENNYTVSDLQIVVQNIKFFVSKIDTQTQELSGEVPKGADYSLPEFTTTFDTTTSDAVSSTTEEQLQFLLKNRQKILEDANAALRTIEIIMGEFTGLGLCDIVAITAALYTMDRDSLLGFLDDDAYDRAKQVIDIPDVRDENKSSVTKALKNLTDTTKNYYNLIEQIYTYILNEDAEKEI